MTAKIIELGQYRSTVRAQNGVQFPQVYRLDGFLYEQGEGDELWVSQDAAEPFYTLNDTDASGLANPTWTPITSIEKGWLIIRHHMRSEFTEGYLDAFMDIRSGDPQQAAGTVYRTKEGIFTLIHRRKARGQVDGLIVYITKMPATNGPCEGTWMDRWHIVQEDGSVSHDIDPFF
jgi:hypothetical protein